MKEYLSYLIYILIYWNLTCGISMLHDNHLQKTSESELCDWLLYGILFRDMLAAIVYNIRSILLEQWIRIHSVSFVTFL